MSTRAQRRFDYHTSKVWAEVIDEVAMRVEVLAVVAGVYAEGSLVAGPPDWFRFAHELQALQTFLSCDVVSARVEASMEPGA